ncbi:MAG: metalloprotease [Planctomycetaceae bacterium]|nr:MAG: metalloprotease [Planctomycetaceae bacterium]
MGQGGGTAVAASFERVLDIAGVPAVSGWDPIVGLLAQSDGGGLAGMILSQLWLWGRVAIGIGLVIFVHELGHFLAAKWCGVKVEKFYVGFDFPIRIGPIRLPRTLGKFRYGETEYGIGTIPLGGYVKMLGQDDDPRRLQEENERIRQAAEDGTGTGETDDRTATVRLDPRSYPAKSVWQRMVIISAGVVMNLITGVMFAAAAFLYGVPYVPAVVGDVSPGGPAFQAGIQPGGKVVGVGGIEQDDQLYFSDMRTAIVLEGTGKPNEPLRVVIEYPDGIRNYDLTPVGVAGIPGLRQVGISNLMTTFLRSAPSRFTMRGSVAAEAMGPEAAGAEVVSIDGEPIPGAGSRDNVPGSVALHSRLVARGGHPVTLGLRLADGSTVEQEIPPQPLLLPGIGLAAGPINALVVGGPAETAGVRVGDTLLAIDGDDRLDAVALPGRLADRTGTVRLTLRRDTAGAAEELDIEVPLGDSHRTSSPINPNDNIVALDRLGLAMPVLPEVAFVRAAVATETPDATEEDASEAAVENGLAPGDRIKKVAHRWAAGTVPPLLSESSAAALREKLETGWEFNVEYPLASLVDIWQFLPAGTGLQVTVERNGRIVEVDTTLAATGEFWHDRGLGFAELQRTHVAAGILPAMKLGVQTGQRKLTEVFRFLGLLVTGKAGANMVGGPITIFRVAGQETNRGIPALLMFLTLLSMNLAILNFLPIPALDGGHMVFLTAEAVLGRPVNERLQMQLTMAGILALLSLMVFAIFNDIRRL